MEDAEKCRKNGWTVGTILEGDEGYGPDRIVITAIGELGIYARQISRKGAPVNHRERSWTLSCRNWKLVGFKTSDRLASPEESARAALKNIITEVCSSLQFDDEHKKALRRIARFVAIGYVGTCGNFQEWLSGHLKRQEYPADLLDGEV